MTEQPSQSPDMKQKIVAKVQAIRNRGLRKLATCYLALIAENPQFHALAQSLAVQYAKRHVKNPNFRILLLWIQPEHVQEVLRCSKRTGYDYWKTLQLLAADTPEHWLSDLEP